MNNSFIKTDNEIAIMREGCQMLAQVMHAMEQFVEEGVKGRDVDVLAEKMIRDFGCEPAFKGYGAEHGVPFPATICFSLNDEIVHGIPQDQIIQNGDLVKIDVGLKHKGYYADMARTFLIGTGSQQTQNLLEVTKKAFNKGIATIRNGSTLYDYAKVVQDYAQQHGYSMVKNLVGHGIGKELHESPQIPNYVAKNMSNFTFYKGMTVAIEPMINAGVDTADIGADGWTYVTGDGQLSTHWENTILVTEKGHEILTIAN